MGVVLLLLIALGIIIFGGSVMLAYRVLHPPRRTLAWALARQQPTDPAGLGLAFDEHAFVAANGDTMPAWIIQGQCATGPVCIFIHGWGDSRYSMLSRYQDLLPAVLLRVSHVVIYDQRGHGDSSAARTGMSVVAGIDLMALISQLDARFEPSGYLLLGSSMGGNAAMTAASRDRQGRIQGVIVEGVYRRLRRPVGYLLRRRRLPAQPFVALTLRLVKLWTRRRVDVDYVDVSPHVRCRLLMLHGQLDPLCPLADAHAIAEAAPHAELVTFDQCSHLDLMVHEPERFAQMVTDFLSSERELVLMHVTQQNAPTA